MKVGCVVSPEREVPRTQAGVGMSTGAATLLTAEIACRWIDEGRIEGMMRWQQAENMRRVSLVAAFPLIGAARSHTTSAHVWLTLPEPWRADEFVDAAATDGVTIAPTHAFVVGRRAVPHAVRLCIGSPPTLDLLEDACARLERLIVTQPRTNRETA